MALRYKSIIALFLLFLLFIIIGSNSEDSHGVLKLEPPKKDKIYFGAFPDFGGSEDNVTTKRLKDFEKVIGKWEINRSG